MGAAMSTALDTIAHQHIGHPPGDVRAPCPYCAKSKRDTALSLTVNTDGSVVAHCHRCGESGTAHPPNHVNGSRRPAARMRQARPAVNHNALWDSGVDPGETIEHPYLVCKQVSPHGIRVKDGLLLVPMERLGGGLVGVQKIDAQGQKLYTKGAKKTGASHHIGEKIKDCTIVICEGYATGASIHEATGHAVQVAFDASNLIHVAQPWANGNASDVPWPKTPTQIIIAADDDYRTPGNPGLTKATEAARATGAKIAVPKWPDGVDRNGGTDFNDLRNQCGDEAVKRAVADARAAEPQAKQDAGRDTSIDGAELLLDVRTYVLRFVAFPSSWCADAVTLWTAHAHMIEHFHTTPRLAAISPEPESGKSRLLEMLATLTPDPMLMLSPSPAALFRKIAAHQITLLVDECDTIFTSRGKEDQNEDLRALLNAGYRRGATIPRCVGPKHDVVEFPVFAATALAGIGDLPDTVMTRSIIFRMRRRAPAEPIEQYRIRVNEPEGHTLRDRLALWAIAVGESAGAAWPTLPPGVADRRAEVWEPLIAVADLAGGDWPERARVAAVADVAAHSVREPSLGVRLLMDIRTVMGDRPSMFTEDLLTKLNALDESPWGDLRGYPLDSRGLAARLRKYAVKPTTVRDGERVSKGYRAADLFDPWTRYLSAPIGAVTSVTSDTVDALLDADAYRRSTDGE